MKRMFASYMAGMLLGVLCLALPGCAGDQPAALVEDHEPVGTQLLRAVPTLKEERFSTLLDFESKDDAVFCNTLGGAGAVAGDKVHTGRSAFRIDPNTSRFAVKLSSLLAGRAFPGEWTLVGGFFFSDQPTSITVGFDPSIAGSEPRTIDVPARAWTAVFAEMPSQSPASTQHEPPNLVFDFESPHGRLWCDDVLLINNFKVLTTTPENPTDASSSSDVAAGLMPPWTVTRRGLSYRGLSPGRFNFQLVNTDASPTGWIVDDANPMRAMFHSNASATNPARTLAIYADGRAFWSGEYKPMSVAARDPILEAQHRSPARIEVAEGMGRVDRNTPGDAHNNGYNGATGSYRIIATGPRIELRFIPTTSAVLSPILELSGLPFGKALVTLEGRLVEQSARSSSGTLLVELPAKIDRAVTVDVRIEE
jgi:hypothetical protein